MFDADNADHWAPIVSAFAAVVSIATVSITSGLSIDITGGTFTQPAT